MSDYVSVAGTGPSAAFFDLDRTLISGSSAFTLATAARAMHMMPTRELLRDAVTAATFKFRGDHDNGASDNARDRILGFVARPAPGRPRRAQRARCSRCCSARSAPRPDACVDLHRHAGRATYIVSAAPQEIVEPARHARSA